MTDQHAGAGQGAAAAESAGPGAKPGPAGRALPLCIRGVTVRLGRTTALDDLSLSVGAGQVVGLLGPNGAGKTTLLRLVMGFVRPERGEILVVGEAPGSRRAAAVIGAALGEPAFYPWLSARQTLDILTAARGCRPGAATRDVLSLTGLAERADQKVGQYSQGMRARLALAAALRWQPSLLLLDEPANSLDPAGIRDIRAIISRERDRGVGVLLASHMVSEVAQTCDTVVILHRGKVRARVEISASTTSSELERQYFRVTEER